MPRSYSFDHFQVPTTLPPSRSLRRRDKQRLAQAPHGPGAAGLHYGRSHAQTEELLKARDMEAQLTHLADLDEAQQRGLEPLPRSAPIGALPAVEELPPRARVDDLVEEARRQLGALRTSIQDVRAAARRLAELPVEAARLAARRLQLLQS